MEQRIIKLSVKNEYILGEGVVIGAAGSQQRSVCASSSKSSRILSLSI